MYQVDKNIPPPGSDHRRKYPFDKMQPGDSFFVPANGKPTRSVIRNLHNCWREVEGEFTSRTVTEDDELGVRVWRVG